MATTEHKRAPALLKAKKAKSQPDPVKPPKVKTSRFKVGDRVRFTYGQREVEGVVTSASGDRVHVDMHFSSESAVPGLFRENELRTA
ncbi:hypothetical protein [Nocardia farcinica]|uniref:hypothetical protein n=1 Tax=Nocardia farcinica TaxID=37329 RepID=UPI0018935AEB|nr:hypothetical protein [Nocardia farcinica]MBF6138814.1 hypothetical protein [Nocardia farcinica]MCZ9328656.1 hypothetical protein [Nocardia farcinica]